MQVLTLLVRRLAYQSNFASCLLSQAASDHDSLDKQPPIQLEPAAMKPPATFTRSARPCAYQSEPTVPLWLVCCRLPDEPDSNGADVLQHGGVIFVLAYQLPTLPPVLSLVFRILGCPDLEISRSSPLLGMMAEAKGHGRDGQASVQAKLEIDARYRGVTSFVVNERAAAKTFKDFHWVVIPNVIGGLRKSMHKAARIG